MYPLISIIIPCYNHGIFIDDAIQSVLLYPYRDEIEIIIVDDGSNDKYTLEKLIKIQQEGITVIFQENQGPSKARNNGIQMAKGKYILPLDADNKIFPEYITHGIEVLDKNPDIGVVYGNCMFFGDEEGEKKVPSNLNIKLFLVCNFIDTCAIFRKKIWEDVGGYDEIMSGYEDWEFWIRVLEKGWRLHHIDKPMFFYRVKHRSRNEEAKLHHEKLAEYIYQKHAALVYENYIAIHTEKHELLREKRLLNKQIRKLKHQLESKSFLLKKLFNW